MPQSFVAQIEQSCRRRQRRRWISALCLALAIIAATALVLVGLDRLLGIADPVGRLLVTLVFAELCILIVRRCFADIWQQPITPLQIAHQVERQHPELRDIVTSAWAFSQQAEEDPTAGSEALRRATIVRATAAVDDIHWQKLIPREPLRRAAFSLGGIVMASGLLGWFVPQALGIGLTRLINPFSTVEWPRQHNLEFVAAPELLAAGEDLALELRDTSGSLPASITMHYRMRKQGQWHEETQPLAVADPSSLDVRRSSVQKSLEYRATGGDHHSMPWHSLNVIAPPRVEDLQITVHPPNYTALPKSVWDKTTAVYAGSKLALDAKTDQPIAAVALRSAKGASLNARIGEDQASFEIDAKDWQVTVSGLYSIELTTPEGLVSQSSTQLAIEVIADQPPQVRFVEPSEDLTVLPTSVIPLRIKARDELSLRQIDLVYQRSDQSEVGDQKISLWRVTDGNDTSVRQQQLEYDWRLADLSLLHNTTIELRAQATDAQPSTGQTPRVLRLTIVSEEELWQQLVDRQARLVEILTQLLSAQRRQLTVTEEWNEFAEWPTARWTNSSHAALFRQRQITDALSAGSDSVLEQLTSLLQAHRRNKLSRHETVERLQTAQALVQNLIDEPLPHIEEQLSQFARLVQNSVERKQLAPLLVKTSKGQEEVIAGLRRAIDLLLQGNVLAQLEKRLVVLRSEQQDLATHCQNEIAPQILIASDLDPALHVSAVRRQRELTRQLAELIQDMSQTADRLADENPTLAMRLSGAVALAGELELQATVQSATDQLASRRVGRLSSLQQETVAGMTKLLARLEGQDAEGLAEQFERLETAERRLQRLRREVAELNRKLQQLTPAERDRELERLRRQREVLAKRTSELTRQLERLKVPRAADATRQAAEQLQRAKLDSEGTSGAKRQLDIAQQRLTDQRRRQQVALARLQMAQLDAKLKALLARQQTVQQETVRLDEIQQVSEQLTAAQRQSLLQLADEQTDLRAEVLAQAESLMRLPVFTYLLKTAAETMQQLEDRLQQADLGEQTQTLVEQTIQQLNQLAAAVRQERKNLSDSGDDQQSGGGGQGDQADAPQGQTLQLVLGQLQLLKTLQTELQTKTQTLESQVAANEPPTHDVAELAREQQQLTELARQLVPEPPDPPTQELFPNLEEELEQLLIQ